MKSNNY